MKNAVIPDWGEPQSGHAVVISGYRETPSGKQFLIHNSWGTSWGDGGYAWVSEKMVVKNLYYAYKVKITNGVPKEDLTDDDCAPDELVDLSTGLCALICSDDSRPNNGCKKK
jgi:aminopeptidase C